MAKWRARNEANRTFIEPPENTRREDPYELRIFYMEDPHRYPGITLKLVRQENPDPRRIMIVLLLRMELQWSEPVYGIEVDFVSASNMRLVFETLESEEN